MSLFRPGAYLQGLFPVTDSFVDTDEPGVKEMSLTTVAPQPFPATESTTNARVSALAGWIPVPVALLVPLPAMSGHLTLPMATSFPPPLTPPCHHSHVAWEPAWPVVAVQVTDMVKPG